ncbi:hypothetical protein ACIBQ1_34360 [Nonomuraea sp. NPDC050153]|uniref:hypothetical protein n=1 Tax=Nonomuraea sp. NPDC050153 TaxID=3364359 RepID=UPI0037B23186
MTTLACSLWAPVPLWEENHLEAFVIGSLAYRTTDPLLVCIDHEPGRFTDYSHALLDESLAYAIRYGEAEIQHCAYDPAFLLARFVTGG